MQPVTYLLYLAAGLTVAGMAESFFLKSKLKKIPIRIHVSGTRGKSSVTRLLAAGLNGNGILTAAKTTGTLPRMILPDGRELPIFRPCGANIIEQARIVSAATEIKAQALVLECMALLPELHWISEDKFVKATHGVITNIRPDHLEVMGPDTRHVALALAGMIPIKGKLYTADKDHLDILKMACEDRQTELVSLTEDEIKSVTKEELSGFTYTEHKENLALCIKILSDFGISRQSAVEAMWKVNPDPGVLTEHKLDFFGREIVFVNAFAANDPESTETISKMIREKYSNIKRFVVVMNLREDRPARTKQFAEDSYFWRDADSIVLMGQGSYLFSRLATKKLKNSTCRLVYTENDSVEEIFEKIIDVCGKSALVLGVGNIGGLGLPLVRYFKNREKLEFQYV